MRAAFLIGLVCASSALAAHPPQRIVSLSPDLTEILYGLGVLGRVVGVSNYDTWPPEATRIERLGQLYSPNYEKLTALRPDLVVINNAEVPFLETTLQDLGLKVLQTSNRSIDEIFASIIAIGHAMGQDREAAQLVAATRKGLDRVAARTAGLPKPRVVMIVNRTPGTLRDLSAATDGSYLAELVGIAGGRIPLARAASGYSRFQKEDLLAADPDIILDFVHGPRSRLSGDAIEAWRELPELKAVRTGRVVEVNEDYVPHASQRIVQTAELFVRLIHQEIR